MAQNLTNVYNSLCISVSECYQSAVCIVFEYIHKNTGDIIQSLNATESFSMRLGAITKTTNDGLRKLDEILHKNVNGE